jgi:hypothetical protein
MATSSGKRDKSQVQATGAKNPAERRSAAVAGLNRSPCERALSSVIQQALALDDDMRQARGEGQQVTPEAANAQARERLTLTLRELDPEATNKIRTLMVAGRDGQGIGVVDTSVSLSETETAFAALAAGSDENGPLLVEYLRRGHAIACAAGIDLERPLTEWQASSADDVDEGAWLSFGRQLAGSSTRDWQCLGVMDPRTQSLSKLYLKLGDRAWWSFQALIDRPTPAGMAKERKAHTRQHSRSIATNSLEAIAGKLDSLRGRALQRAARAIRARIGQPVQVAEG